MSKDLLKISSELCVRHTMLEVKLKINRIYYFFSLLFVRINKTNIVIE